MAQLDINDLDSLIGFLGSAIYARVAEYTNLYPNLTPIRIEDYLLFDYNLDTIFSSTPIRYRGTKPTGIKRMVDGELVETMQHIFHRRGVDAGSVVAIIPYDKESDIQNMAHPININCIMRKIGAEQVTNHRSSRFILPIINVVVKGSDLEPYPKVYSKGIEPDRYYCVQVSEKYAGIVSLETFLKTATLEFTVIRGIIYQVVDILYRMTDSYKDFRHHYFFPSMIDCYLMSNSGVMYPQLKLSSYFTASIGESVPNDYQNPEITDYSIKSSYADFYQMMNYLWNTIRPDIEKHSDLVEIFDVCLPHELRSPGLSLTPEAWESLGEERQHSLRIKNLRLHRVLSGREMMVLSDFVDQDEEFGATSELEDTDDAITGGEESDPEEDDSESEQERNEDDAEQDDAVLEGLMSIISDSLREGKAEIFSDGFDVPVSRKYLEQTNEAPASKISVEVIATMSKPSKESSGSRRKPEKAREPDNSVRDEPKKSRREPVNSIYDDPDEEQSEDSPADPDVRRPMISPGGRARIIESVRGYRPINRTQSRVAEIAPTQPQRPSYEPAPRGVDPYYAAIMGQTRAPEQNYAPPQPTYNSFANLLGHPSSAVPQNYQQYAPAPVSNQVPLPQQGVTQEQYMAALAQSNQAGGGRFFLPQQ